MPDAQSFERFYRENLSRIVRACALVLLDVTTAQDVAAEAFTRLWGRWSRIQNDDHAGGYVFKTAMRLSAREARRRHRRPMPPGSRVEDDLERAAVRLDLAVALRGLSVQQRQAVVLRDWAGLETEEVARILGIRDSTVRVHLARGRAHLREALHVREGVTP